MEVGGVGQQGCSDSCALSGDGPLPGEPVACQRWQVRNGKAAKAQAAHCVCRRISGRLDAIGWGDEKHRKVGGQAGVPDSVSRNEQLKDLWILSAW